jgi:hypothetical protein
VSPETDAIWPLVALPDPEPRAAWVGCGVDVDDAAVADEHPVRTIATPTTVVTRSPARLREIRLLETFVVFMFLSLGECVG